MKKLDYQKIQELRDKGLSLTAIAKQLSCTKGAVSKILKKMGKTVATKAVEAAPKYEKKFSQATDHLLYLADRARSELNWLDDIEPQTNDQYRNWQDQKLKFAAEMRKLISAISDISYKLFQAEEIREILQIIDEEIGCESLECQKKIRDRIERRRAIRFGTQSN